MTDIEPTAATDPVDDAPEAPDTAVDAPTEASDAAEQVDTAEQVDADAVSYTHLDVYKRQVFDSGMTPASRSRV